MALKLPFVCVLEWNFFGPLTTVTLCGALPVHFQTTAVPRLTLTVALFEERTKKLSPTFTVFVAASAGMAKAAAAATTARASTRKRFISLSRCRGVASGDAAGGVVLPGLSHHQLHREPVNGADDAVGPLRMWDRAEGALGLGLGVELLRPLGDRDVVRIAAGPLP